MRLGKALVVSGYGGYYYLAHQMPGGVQLSIENWPTVAGAFQFCHSCDPVIRAEYEIRDVLLPDRECRMLLALVDGVMQIGQIARIVKTNVATSVKRATKMRNSGLITFDGPASPSSYVEITEKGSGIAATLLGGEP
jgi:hypothetical protein